MSSQTTNLKLHKIDLTDSPPDITVLNANWDALDTAVTGKQATVTGGASTITSSNLTASRALISNSSGKVAVSEVTSTELGYLDGVTSAIQTQLNGKSASGHTHGAATTSVAGFMSAADKTKLDGITAGANAYTLPAAGTALGGVKSGGDVTISNGTITVNDDSHNHTVSNIDNLQALLDDKLSRTGGKLLGNLEVKNKYELGACYNFANGCLIDLGASANNTMFLIHVTGNSYNASWSPINSMYQFYDHVDGILECSGLELGSPLGAMTVYRYNGRMYAWIKPTKTYQTLSFTIASNKTSLNPTITDAVAHTSGYTNLTTITPKTIYTKDQINRMFRPLIPAYGTQISNNADLNTVNYLKVGTYFSGGNTTVEQYANCPTNICFTMEVSVPNGTTAIDNETTAAWTYRLRKIRDYDGNEYVQKCQTDATPNNWIYGPWRKILKDTDIANLNKSVKVYHAYSSSDGYTTTDTNVEALALTINTSQLPAKYEALIWGYINGRAQVAAQEKATGTGTMKVMVGSTEKVNQSEDFYTVHQTSSANQNNMGTTTGMGYSYHLTNGTSASNLKVTLNYYLKSTSDGGQMQFKSGGIMVIVVPTE